MAGTKRKRTKYTREELHETIEIRVIDNGTVETFKLFRVLTARYAPNFAALFLHRNISAIELKDITPFILRYFTGWLRACYVQDADTDDDLWMGQGVPCWEMLGDNIYYDNCGDPLICNNMYHDWMDRATTGIDMFLFAQTFDIPRLSQDALDRLVWCFCPNQYFHSEPYFDWEPLSRSICLAYMHTPTSSPIRKVLIDGFSQLALLGNDDFLLGMPQKFLVDIIREGKHIIKNLVPDHDLRRKKGLSACDYHEHKNEAEKASCKVRVHM